MPNTECQDVFGYVLPLTSSLGHTQYEFAISLLPFLGSALNVVFGVSIVIALRKNYLLALKGQLRDLDTKGAADTRFPLVFPIYYKIILSCCLTSFSFVLLGMFEPGSPSLGLGIFVPAALARTMQNSLEVGIAVLLLQRSVGYVAIRFATTASVVWGVVYFGIDFMSGHADYIRETDGEPYNTAGLLIADAILLGFFMCVLLSYVGGALQWLSARRAVVPFCLYQVLLRTIYIAVRALYLGPSQEASYCIRLPAAVVRCGFIVVVYACLAIDSRFWRKLEYLAQGPYPEYTSMDGSREQLLDLPRTGLRNLGQCTQYLVDFSELAINTREVLGVGNKDTTVYLARYKNRDVAVKRIFCDVLTIEIIEQHLHEAAVLSLLDNPHVVKFLGVCIRPPSVCLVTEYCSHGSLFSYLARKRATGTALEVRTMLSFAVQAATAVEYLHSLKPPIIHRDIKSPNFLMDGGYTLKLSDFGDAHERGKRLVVERGSVEWMAPELFLALKVVHPSMVPDASASVASILSRAGTRLSNSTEVPTITAASSSVRSDGKGSAGGHVVVGLPARVGKNSGSAAVTGDHASSERSTVGALSHLSVNVRTPPRSVAPPGSEHVLAVLPAEPVDDAATPLLHQPKRSRRRSSSGSFATDPTTRQAYETFSVVKPAGVGGSVVDGSNLSTKRSGSVTSTRTKSRRQGTPGYDEKVDIYALGILFWELVSDTPLPYPAVPPQEVPWLVVQGLRPSVPAHAPEPLAQLITACWAADSAVRPTATEIRQRLRDALGQYPATPQHASSTLSGRAAAAAASAQTHTEQISLRGGDAMDLRRPLLAVHPVPELSASPARSP